MKTKMITAVIAMCLIPSAFGLVGGDGPVDVHFGHKYFREITNVGPGVKLFCAHGVSIEWARKIGCVEEFKNGESCTLGGGNRRTTYRVSKKYFQSLYKEESPTRLADIGVANDWMLTFSAQEAERARDRTDFLTLDFEPISIGEKIMIIAKNNPYLTLATGIFEVKDVDQDSAFLLPVDREMYTAAGDSGFPWLRVEQDRSIKIVGIHSTGSTINEYGYDRDSDDGHYGCKSEDELCWPKYSSGIGLFSDAESKAAIGEFVRDTGAQLCGYNLECDSIKLP